ncbi:hypothetical protein VP01_396g1 [Puccinia sorghi]|uniref:Uncharacterized protein n=1 Tax=Puccinia sorghi TaxID=27349 RepID=A0A0L6UT64_9BASI|nr:hypothetical protein VP01_396g1 [Puccinia sorghi]
MNNSFHVCHTSEEKVIDEPQKLTKCYSCTTSIRQSCSKVLNLKNKYQPRLLINRLEICDKKITDNGNFHIHFFSVYRFQATSLEITPSKRNSSTYAQGMLNYSSTFFFINLSQPSLQSNHSNLDSAFWFPYEGGVERISHLKLGQLECVEKSRKCLSLSLSLVLFLVISMCFLTFNLFCFFLFHLCTLLFLSHPINHTQPSSFLSSQPSFFSSQSSASFCLSLHSHTVLHFLSSLQLIVQPSHSMITFISFSLHFSLLSYFSNSCLEFNEARHSRIEQSHFLLTLLTNHTSNLVLSMLGKIPFICQCFSYQSTSFLSLGTTHFMNHLQRLRSTRNNASSSFSHFSHQYFQIQSLFFTSLTLVMLSFHLSQLNLAIISNTCNIFNYYILVWLPWFSFVCSSTAKKTCSTACKVIQPSFDAQSLCILHIWMADWLEHAACQLQAAEQLFFAVLTFILFHVFFLLLIIPIIIPCEILQK